jgi:hypothetical protein
MFSRDSAKKPVVRWARSGLKRLVRISLSPPAKSTSKRWRVPGRVRGLAFGVRSSEAPWLTCQGEGRAAKRRLTAYHRVPSTGCQPPGVAFGPEGQLNLARDFSPGLYSHVFWDGSRAGVFAPEGQPESSPALQCRVGHLKENPPHRGARKAWRSGGLQSGFWTPYRRVRLAADCRWPCGAPLPSVLTGRILPLKAPQGLKSLATLDYPSGAKANSTDVSTG